MQKDQISFADFAKLDLRVGEIKNASVVEGSEKLFQLQVDFGEELGTRTIYAGIKPWYSPENLTGRRLIFVVNLAPKTFKINGVEHTSFGMMMAAGDDEAVLYQFDKELPAGTIIR